MALRAVWEPTIETNQRPSVSSSRAKASAVAEKPPGANGVQNLPRTRYGVFGVYGVGREHGKSPFGVL